jgi:hypothetical protein
MAKKSFDITGTKKAQENDESTHKLETFISGSERQTTITVQLPERLKFSLKKEALDRRTTVKNLLIEILDTHFAESK